jgi:hypothetical protein
MILGKKFITIIVISTTVLLSIVLYLSVYPLYGEYFPKCFFYTFTGLYCPGCGTQRAIVALLHGDILKALRENFLAVSAFPFLIYSFVILCLKTFSGKHLDSKIFYSPLFVKIVLIMVITFAVIRNIPVYPFTFLTPL